MDWSIIAAQSIQYIALIAGIIGIGLGMRNIYLAKASIRMAENSEKNQGLLADLFQKLRDNTGEMHRTTIKEFEGVSRKLDTVGTYLEGLQNEMDEEFKAVNKELAKTSQKFDKINSILSTIWERTEVARISANLQDQIWTGYLKRAQQIALYKGFLVAISGKRRPSEQGRLLIRNLADTIEELVTSEDKQKANNNYIIAALPIETLLQETEELNRDEKDVSIDDMLAIIGAYIDELKEDESP